MYDDHDMAKALILSEEISTTVVDKVKAHGMGHGELGEPFYLTANVSKLRQIPNEKHCSEDPFLTSSQAQWHLYTHTK